MVVRQIDEWIRAQEGEHFEFKEARNRYSFEDLARYCCALANEGGGKVILGVTDRRPRRVVGSQAFGQLEETRRALMERIPLRISATEVHHPRGRVLIFEVPPRPVGVPIKYDDVYWSRRADSLVSMPEDELRLVFAESGRDFSAEVCDRAGLEDLQLHAIEDFRKRWIEKSKNSALSALPPEQLLRDAEVLVEDGVTYAALILYGAPSALRRFLGQAEVVFEYRSSEAPGPAQQRKEYRQGFFSYYDDLWSTINLRNDLQHFQQGLFVWDVPTFNERAVREAVLNAVSHRDYHHPGSIFVRQYPRRIEVVSPGGFPPGITAENILWQQHPRNRRIAEVLGRCGLVERAGQGFDLIFRECIRQSKPLPDLSRTDAHSVWLTLQGEIQDREFLRFLEEIGRERMAAFSTDDFLLIDVVHRALSVPEYLRPRIEHLVEQGVIERVGHGRGVRLLLSQRFYRHLGKGGTYTRKRGLDRETNKALLLKHIHDNQATGSKMEELRQVLPALARSQIQVLLRELVRRDAIHVHGATRAARWYPGAERPDCNHDAERSQ